LYTSVLILKLSQPVKINCTGDPAFRGKVVVVGDDDQCAGVSLRSLTTSIPLEQALNISGSDKIDNRIIDSINPFINILYLFGCFYFRTCGENKSLTGKISPDLDLFRVLIFNKKVKS